MAAEPMRQSARSCSSSLDYTQLPIEQQLVNTVGLLPQELRHQFNDIGIVRPGTRMFAVVHGLRDTQEKRLGFQQKALFCTQKLPQSAANADRSPLVRSLGLFLLLLGRAPSTSRAKPQLRPPISAQTDPRRRIRGSHDHHLV